jgi:hypothetical protein
MSLLSLGSIPEMQKSSRFKRECMDEKKETNISLSYHTSVLEINHYAVLHCFPRQLLSDNRCQCSCATYVFVSLKGLRNHSSSIHLTSFCTALERGTPTTPRDATSVQEKISLCTQYAYYATPKYEILNNLWGIAQATSGSQCTYVDSTSDSAIAWSTEWTWAGGQDNVKSYPYAGRLLTKGNVISKVKSMPTVARWSYNTTDIRCNVAYDVFTAADPNHVNSSGDYELMIW